MNELEQLKKIYKKLEDIGNRWVIVMNGPGYSSCKVSHINFNENYFVVFCSVGENGMTAIEKVSFDYLADEEALTKIELKNKEK